MAEGTQWRPDGSRHGENRPVRYRPTPGKAAAVAVAIGGIGLLYLALELYRAWQDYSSVLVQAVTGRDGTIYGLLAVLALAGAGLFFWGSSRLWRGDE
jgi:hypothetical protein